MTPLETLALMQQRRVVFPDEYYSLDLVERQYAFTASKLASLEQMQSVLNALKRSIAEGTTFADFKKQIKADGIKLPESYLDNVFRTNIQSAYSRGRWLEQQANKDKRPYLMYMAILDSRTRPSHKRLHKIVRHIDDPFWLRFYPPWGFRCRCYVIALTEKQAIAAGITPDDKLPNLEPEAGWGWRPDQPVLPQMEAYVQSQFDEIASQTPEAVPAIERMKVDIREGVAATQQTISLLSLSAGTRSTIPEMVQKAADLDKNIAPSAVGLMNEYANGTGAGIDEFIKTSRNTGLGSRVMDWIRQSFDSVLKAAKSLKKRITGNMNTRGHVFGKGQVLGINTPSLFRDAAQGQRIEIINARGVGVDLSKLGSDGVLLPPDIRLEVVDVFSDRVVMQPTTKAPNFLFSYLDGALLAM